jgi:DNA-binding IscR family transcriptional regulator
VLARAPESISLREVVEVLEGDLSVVPCVDDPAACERFEHCGAATVWQQVAGDIRNRLSAWTLAELAAEWRGKQHVGADYEI